MGSHRGETGQVHTILVVDDQEVNRMLLREYLQHEGYRVVLADNGADALRIVNDGGIDMLLLDVVMNDIDGLQVCRLLKSDAKTMFLPVVMVTTLSNREDRIKAIEAGADEFLSKPVYPEELLARVKSLLRWHDARRELEESRRREIENVFKRYLSPRVVEEILTSPQSPMRFQLDETRRRDAVILFTDLRGFTAVAEGLAAEHVVKILNEYFSEMTRAAHAFEGTLFNMTGDGLLAGFGVPFEQDAPGERAMAAAVQMQREFACLAEHWRDEYAVELGLGIGINRGEVVFGNIGSDAYMNYTIIGDPVNVADRLQQIAGAGEIVISESVVRSLSEKWSNLCHARTEPVQLKGRRGSIHVYSCCPSKEGDEA